MSMVSYRILKLNEGFTNECSSCKNCLGLKLLEMGFFDGQKILIKEITNSMYTLSGLDEKNNSLQTIGIRENEIKKITTEGSCVVKLVA